ncbi:GntR family transcriptional regulator [Actinocrispum wychmicini]|nr:GntR family transcriptional regulator [Actinocrispum wychmicini]
MTIRSRQDRDAAEVGSPVEVNIAVSRTLGIPLATQIRDQIVAAISVGDLRPGDRLPTIRQLAEFLDINRNTVAQVYRLLEAEGYLSTRAGGGTTVAAGAATVAATVAGALREIVTQALRRAEAAGFTAREFAELAYYQAAARTAVPAARILVIDEYQGELDFLRTTVSQTLPDSVVDAALLAHLQRADPAQRAQRLAGFDFAVVAFYSLDQAQPVLAEADLPLLAAGIGPSLHSLRRITEECGGKQVAIVCTEPEGPPRMEASLRRAGITFSSAPRHAHVHQDNLTAVLASCEAIIASQGSTDALTDLAPGTPIITYSRLLSDETLATLRTYTEYVARRRNPTDTGT